MRKAKKNTPRKASRPGTMRDVSLTSRLDRIIDLESVQARGVVPRVRDITPIMFRRDRPFTIDKTVSLGTVALSATADMTAGVSFILGQVPEVTSLTSIFDAYRIIQAEISFVPLLSNVATPPLYTVIDYDDASPLTSLGATLEYDTLLITQSGQLNHRVLTPRTALAAYSGSFTSYAQNSRTWVDAASPNVQYYGVKYYLPALTGATPAQAYTIAARYVIQFRNTR